MSQLDAAALAAMIDHTLLAADASSAQVTQLCQEARQYGFHSVCINSSNVYHAALRLRGSAVKVCAVVGFPLGASFSQAKAFEAECAVAAGAGEIDMVLNIAWLKESLFDHVREDISQVLHACGPVPLTVILETCLLDDIQTIRACEICRDLGVAFIKTSTGFGSGGATVADVSLMRRIAGAGMGVKASGGVDDTATAYAMLEAGAARLGCSVSLAIIGQ